VFISGLLFVINERTRFMLPANYFEVIRHIFVFIFEIE